MNNKLLIMLFIFLMLLSQIGCSTVSNNVDIDIHKLSDSLYEHIDFNDDMSAVDDFITYNLYYIDEENVESSILYVSSGATAEEIAIFRAKDADSLTIISEGANMRLDDQKASFKTYEPSEMVKLEDPILVSVGDYVIVCISNDNDTAMKIINEYVGN